MQRTYRTKNLLALLIAVLILGLASCVQDNFDFDRFDGKINYKPSLALPLAHGTLTLGDLLEPDDTLVFFEEDNTVRLALRMDTLFMLEASDFLEIEAPPPVMRNFDIQPLGLNDISTEASITLDFITTPGNMWDEYAYDIRGRDGTNSHFIGVGSPYVGIVPASALDDIDYAHLTGGDFEMKVTNNLPVKVSFMLNLVNMEDNSYIGGHFFENLQPGEVATAEFRSEYVMLRHEPGIEIMDFYTPGSGDEDVFVDLQDDIYVEVTAENLKADMGNARVPFVTFAAAEELLPVIFPGGELVDDLVLDSGKVYCSADNYSSGISLNAEMVNVDQNGASKSIELITDGMGHMKEEEQGLGGLAIDFDDWGNNIAVRYTVSAGWGDEIRPFDVTPGNIGYVMEFSGFVTGYATGFFGTQEIGLDDEEFDLGFDLFDRLTGDFRLTNPSVRLFYENNAGVPVNLSFNLDALSGDGQKRVLLLPEDHPGFEIATPDQPFENAEGEIVIDRETSEIVEFIALPPASIRLEAKGLKNPEGDTGVPNFITSESRLLMGMDIDLPLELRLTDLQFADTLELGIEADDADIIERVVLSIDVSNRFPLGAELDLSLYDSVNNNVVYTFETIMLLDAADVDAGGFVVPGPGKSSAAEVEITGSTVGHLREAGHLILSARLNTGRYNDEQVPVKLQTTNGLDFRIRLRADMNVSN